MDNSKKLYHKDGWLQYEEYHVDIGRMLNILVDKHYYENGNILGESYSRLGKLHNEIGPALVMYDINGEILELRWYLNGNEYSFSDWAVAINPADELAIELRLTYGCW